MTDNTMSVNEFEEDIIKALSVKIGIPVAVLRTPWSGSFRDKEAHMRVMKADLDFLRDCYVEMASKMFEEMEEM